jgi:hypothetical protein
MNTPTIACKICGCEEFISNPNCYDVYKHREGKLVFVQSEFVNESLELFCRECSNKLEFNTDDIKF